MIHLYIFSMYKRYLERSSRFLSSVYNVKLSWPRLLSLQWHPIYHVVHYMVNGLPFVDWSNSYSVVSPVKLPPDWFSCVTALVVNPPKKTLICTFIFFINMVFNNKKVVEWNGCLHHNYWLSSIYFCFNKFKAYTFLVTLLFIWDTKIVSSAFCISLVY